jgi:hypothetical protein
MCGDLALLARGSWGKAEVTLEDLGQVALTGKSALDREKERFSQPPACPGAPDAASHSQTRPDCGECLCPSGLEFTAIGAVVAPKCFQIDYAAGASGRGTSSLFSGARRLPM